MQSIRSGTLKRKIWKLKTETLNYKLEKEYEFFKLKAIKNLQR